MSDGSDSVLLLDLHTTNNTLAASFNEKLLLSNGLVISPLKNATAPSQYPHSLKEVVHAIDNKKDLEDYVTSYHSKLPPKTSEPRYERHPV